MRRFASLFLTLIFVFTFVVTMAACSGKIKVTFVQDGCDDVVVTLEKGETLTEIPKPAQEDGYTIVWDKTEFDGLTESITVTAVKTPNKYTINYEIKENWESISATSQIVTFGEEFTLLVPTNKNTKLVFDGWTVKDTNEAFTDDGVYSVVGNVTLVATWKVADNGGEWSDNPFA